MVRNHQNIVFNNTCLFCVLHLPQLFQLRCFLVYISRLIRITTSKPAVGTATSKRGASAHADRHCWPGAMDSFFR